MTAVLSLAAARAARGLPDLGPDRMFQVGDLVRVLHPDGSYAAGWVSGIRSTGEIAVTCRGEITAFPRDRLQPLPPLADGTPVRGRRSGLLGRVITGSGTPDHYAVDLGRGWTVIHRVDLDPCAGPFGSDDGAVSTPEPPEAA